MCGDGSSGTVKGVVVMVLVVVLIVVSWWS